MNQTDRCRICGLTESEHHAFMPTIKPKGCVCNPGEWGYDITPVCKKYKGDGKDMCETCDHDKECHIVDKSRTM